jgi:peptidoglycan/xylan/chitin deacetylase (PgdA/CDA1 family)
MWDVLSGDFDEEMTAERCVKNVVDNVRPGSIIVMHDNYKSFEILKEALPKILTSLQEKGFVFKAIEPAMASSTVSENIAFARAAV